MPSLSTSIGRGLRANRVFFILGLLVGFAIWVASPILIGHREPWDSPYPFYSTVFLMTGALVGYLRPTNAPGAGVAGWIGAWAGQVVVISMGDREWLSLGIITTGIGGLLFPFGIALGSFVKRKTNGPRR